MATEPKIAAYKPYDVNQFKSRDAAAAVLLANSLEWTIIHRENGPVQLIADDGKQIRVPDNTGIKMDIFRGWIHQIATHSNDLSIDRKLVDHIVKATKINRDHARLMYELVEDGDLAFDEMTLTQGQVDAINAATEDEGAISDDPYNPNYTMGIEPYILTRKPFLNHNGVDTGNAYVRVWSDDHIDYECQRCGAVFPSIKGVGSHKQLHIQRGEVAGMQIKHKKGKKARDYDPEKPSKAKVPEPRPERMVQVSETVAAEAMRTLRVLDEIRDLIGDKEMREELATARARIARLEGNLNALRDLLGDV